MPDKEKLLMKTIHLNFLGKDSVPFDNDIKVSDKVYSLLQTFIKGKGPKDRLFNQTSREVAWFLGNIVPGLTPKNLRTVKANQEFVEAAKEILETETPKSEVDKVRVFYRANKAVAEKLNHQRNIAKNFKESKEKLETKYKESKVNTNERIKKLKEKSRLYELEMKKNALTIKDPNSLKIINLGLKEKLTKVNLQIEKAKLALERKEFQLEKKAGTKEISLSTSLASYLDPRICFSLCKELELDPGRVYTKAQLELFDWAQDVEADLWRNM